MAIRDWKADVVMLLLKHKADPNTVLADMDGKGALHVASAKGHGEVVEQLLSSNADVNLKEKSEWSAADCAIAAKNGEVIEVLREKGAPTFIYQYPPVGGPYEKPTLTADVIKRRHEAAEPFRKRYAYSRSDGMPAFGNSPLVNAAASGDMDAVKALLARIDVNFQAPYNGSGPLHGASGNGHREVAELLLSSNADVNLANNNGYGPLHVASIHGDREVAELLLSSNADVNLKSSVGWSAADYAIQFEKGEVIEVLRRANTPSFRYEYPPVGGPYNNVQRKR